ncbi:unnamed protein product [Nezara viridula]|uniref:Uncharacterized protein n=1 Tax=Nezara viridula TaxID=85310 RepID=A0A9P0HQS1_NEZVI|nr:unnamed protein product [Nezara viridula]
MKFFPEITSSVTLPYVPRISVVNCRRNSLRRTFYKRLHKAGSPSGKLMRQLCIYPSTVGGIQLCKKLNDDMQVQASSCWRSYDPALHFLSQNKKQNYYVKVKSGLGVPTDRLSVLGPARFLEQKNLVIALEVPSISRELGLAESRGLEEPKGAGLRQVMTARGGRRLKASIVGHGIRKPNRNRVKVVGGRRRFSPRVAKPHADRSHLRWKRNGFNRGQNSFNTK